MIFKHKNEVKILDLLNSIESFIDGDINFIAKDNFDSSGFGQMVLDKLHLITSKLENKNKEELQIYGEVMVVSGKIERGIIEDKIYHTNTSNIKLNYIAKTINSLVDILKNNIRESVVILDEYSKNNYMKELNTNIVSNDFKLLFEGINTLKKSITEILIENKSNGLTLQNSSEILLSNVNELNISSNEAATSLEETAAALEQITSNIRNNTQNISEMSKYSNEVTISATNGEKLANQTTIAMEEINSQVNSINDAISIIDQIAFQTNILSLNAAVEAATAGEAGKGFAVVAQEVRNLASRSAEAAREIKKIVENATNKANQGKSIANHMINGYKELNENIQQTLNLINHIEMASKEQLSGIEQINTAIIQLDQQTQKNAQIASQTQDIAIITDKMANLVVNNANEKKFIGKNEVKANNLLY